VRAHTFTSCRATTTVFRLLNAMLLRPLPVRDAATLVSVDKPTSDGNVQIHTISYPDYGDYRAGTTNVGPLTYVGTALVLAVVAVAASYVPARNAARTDPLVALRQD
jgi:hypothetical protein